MKRRRYVLGGSTYPTKSAVTCMCRGMLNGGPLDNAFLSDLLALHPEAEQKVGTGVASFYVAPDGFGGRCFWLERIDGTKTDWSFRSCLNPPTHEQEVRSALRQIIVDQVLAFRDDALASRPACAITGIPLTAESAHVDHRPPTTFLMLVERFLHEQRLAYGDVAVKPTEDGSTTTELADEDLVEAWRTFHAQEAVLQLTSARANLSQGQGR